MKKIWKDNTSIGSLERTLYKEEILIENKKMNLELYSPCSIENELDITFCVVGDRDFDELVGFQKPIIAFRKIVKNLVRMISFALNDKNWILTITVDCKKRQSIYEKICKQYGYLMLGIGNDEFLLIKN